MIQPGLCTPKLNKAWLGKPVLIKNTLPGMLNQGFCCDMQMGLSLALTACICSPSLPVSIVQAGGGGGVVVWGVFLVQIRPP